MKPLGLEGKVGAPAIVRTNPLLRKYDEDFGPSYDRNPQYPNRQQYLNRLVDSFLPFTWRDVLGVVQERYAGSADEVLSGFLSLCSGVLSDSVLVYDLETPSLGVKLGRGGACPPLGVLRGSCAWFSCDHALVFGEIRHVCARNAVVLSSVGAVDLRRGFGLFSPGLTGSSPTYAEVYIDAVLCSSVPIEYPECSDGVVCAPGDLVGLGHPDRSLLGLVDDPLRLRSALVAVQSSLDEWRWTTECASLRERVRSDPLFSDAGTYRIFTPRGAQR